MSRGNVLSNSEFDPLNLIGQILNDTYLIEDFIGSGGMCYVYKAKQQLLNKAVAIKLLLPQFISNQNVVQRFQQEGKTAASLSHQNIINIFNLNISEQGYPYLVMEYFNGISLSNLIKAEKSLNQDQALKIFQQILSALKEAHDKNIIHRDLKPSNILIAISEDGQIIAKLTDFGIAKVLTNDDENMKLTKTGEIFGSPLYMSPEQCRGEKLDKRSDIYSLGCLMYECLTGQPPFRVTSIVESIYSHINEFPKRFKIVNPNNKINFELENVVLKCLSKEPNSRYDDVGIIIKELVQIEKKRQINPISRIVKEIQIFLTEKFRLNKLENILILAITLLLSTCVYIYFFINSETEKIINSDTMKWHYDLTKYFGEVKNNSLSSQDNSLNTEESLHNSWLAPTNVANNAKYDPIESNYDPIIAYKSLMKSAKKFIKEGNYLEAYKLYKNDILILSAKINGEKSYPYLECKLHYAYCLDRLNRFDEAKAEYNKLIKLVNSIMLGRRHDMFLNNCCKSLIQMEGREALTLANSQSKLSTLKINSIIEDYKQILDLTNKLPKMLYVRNNDDQTFNDYFIDLQSICMSQIGDYYTELPQYKEAINYYSNAIPLFQKIINKDSNYNLKICQYKLANAFYLNEDYSSAIEELNKLLIYSNNIADHKECLNFKKNILNLKINIFDKSGQFINSLISKFELLTLKFIN